MPTPPSTRTVVAATAAPFGYAGKRVVVSGHASGIGAATAHMLADQGAHVIGLDLCPGDDPRIAFHRIDLADHDGIAARAAAIPGTIDLLFNCAGVSDSTGISPQHVLAINFIGTRTLTDALLPRIAGGGAVASIASTGGWGWRGNLAQLRALVATPDAAAARSWCAAHTDLLGRGYTFSKEAVIVWTMTAAVRSIADGIRINCVCPGPVQTPMLDAIIADLGAPLIDSYAWPICRRAVPAEVAAPLLFLNSPLASYVNGVALDIDGGLHGAAESGLIDLAAVRDAAGG